MSAWLVGKAKHVPFIYNVQDLYRTFPSGRGSYLIPLPLLHYSESKNSCIERQPILRSSRSPFAITSYLRVSRQRRSRLFPTSSTRILFDLFPRRIAGQQHGLADKFVVTHAGNLGYVYDLDTMLDAASLLSSKKDILFLIVGNGVAKPELEKNAHERKLENVRFMPFQPYESLPWMRASSDVQLSLYKNGAANHSFPSKVYEIMASGRPLLASSEAESGIEHLVQSTECGLCVRPENAEQLAEAVLNLYRDSSLRETMGNRGRRYAEENHSKGAAVAGSTELLQQLSAQKRSS